jgi:hypothetical protein
MPPARGPAASPGLRFGAVSDAASCALCHRFAGGPGVPRMTWGSASADRSFISGGTTADASGSPRRPRGSRFAGTDAAPVSAGAGGRVSPVTARRQRAAVTRYRLSTRETLRRVRTASRGGRPEVRHRLRTGPAPASTETRRTPGRLRGATNPRPAFGGNRRGGEKPRGRNALGASSSAGPTGACSPVADERGRCRRRGARISREEALPRGGTDARESASKRRPRSRGPSAPTLLELAFRGGPGTRSGRRKGTPRGPGRQRRKVEEGAGKAKRPATVPAVRAAQHRFRCQQLQRP